MPGTTSRPPGRRAVLALLPALALLTAACAAVLLTAAPAAAHAALTGSTPEDGEVVPEAPRDVTLTFSEKVAVSPDSIRVLDPAGERVEDGAVTAMDGGDAVYGVPLPADLAPGTYTVAWQVVSTDSHPVSGAFTFSVGAPSETSVDAAGPGAGGPASTVTLLYGTARYAAYAGFVLLAGGSAFVLLYGPAAARVRTVQRAVVTGWAALTAATLALLLLRRPYETSGPLTDAFDPAGLRAVIGSGPGTALTARLLLMAAAGFFVALLFGTWARAHERAGAADGPRQRDLTRGLAAGGAAVAACIAATWALAEHASSGPQVPLAVPSHIVHLLAVAGWLGGLTVLLLLLHRGHAVPRAVVRRFSVLALTCVSALVVTGLYQSWRQTGSWDALTGTSYGALLLAKTGLFGLLLAAAWISRRWTARLADAPAEAQEKAEHTAEGADGAAVREASVPGPAASAAPAAVADPVRAQQLARQRAAVERTRLRQRRDADPARRGLRRSVLAEAVIAVLVLAVTTALTGTSPARTEAAAQESGAPAGSPAGEPAGPVSLTVPFDTGGEHGRGTVLLDVEPGRVGDNTLHIRLTDPEGLPTGAVEVQAALTLPAEDLGPLRHEPDHTGVGHWTAPGVLLPRPGEWELSLTIRTSDIDQVTETVTFSVE